MYLLIKTTLKDYPDEDVLEIVGNCEDYGHRTAVLKRYCDQNNINLVADRAVINSQCKPNENELYSYLTDGKYILLDCLGVGAGILFSGYVQKKCIGYFQFKFYKPENLPLSNIKIEFPKKII